MESHWANQAPVDNWWLSLILSKCPADGLNEFDVVQPKPRRHSQIQMTECKNKDNNFKKHSKSHFKLKYASLFVHVVFHWCESYFPFPLRFDDIFSAGSMSPLSLVSWSLLAQGHESWVLKDCQGQEEGDLDVCHSNRVRDHSGGSSWGQLQIKTLRWEKAPESPRG